LNYAIANDLDRLSMSFQIGLLYINRFVVCISKYSNLQTAESITMVGRHNVNNYFYWYIWPEGLYWCWAPPVGDSWVSCSSYVVMYHPLEDGFWRCEPVYSTAAHAYNLLSSWFNVQRTQFCLVLYRI